MRENIFVYSIPMPDGVHEMVVPCLDGYTVYIDQNLTHEQRREMYRHAVREHIAKNHFERENVQQIESEAREKKGE